MIMSDYDLLIQLRSIVDSTQFHLNLQSDGDSYHGARLQLVKDYLDVQMLKIENDEREI
jgi:hypothetical protein